MIKKSITFLVAMLFFWVCLATTALAYKDCSTACNPGKCCENNYNEALNNAPTWQNVIEYMVYGTTPECVDTCISGCIIGVITTALFCHLAGGSPEACMALAFVGYWGCIFLCMQNCPFY
jgi:hypothetical protein